MELHASVVGIRPSTNVWEHHMQAISTTQQLGARDSGHRQPLFGRIRSYCAALSARSAESVRLAKRSVFLSLLVLGIALPTASGIDPVTQTSPQNHDRKEMSQAVTAEGVPIHGSQKEIEFVLAEVRKTLDSNPYTEVVELLVDPDYHGVDGAYLVNVILNAQGRKILVGVIVTLRPVANQWETTMEFVD
jgi:hypothetical protein